MGSILRDLPGRSTARRSLQSTRRGPGLAASDVLPGHHRRPPADPGMGAAVGRSSRTRDGCRRTGWRDYLGDALMPTQSDTLIGPIITELTSIAQQITDIGTVYTDLPEAAPEDNSVMFACRHIDINSATSGKLDIHYNFAIIHSFRRTRLPNDLARCYAAMPAWAQVLSSPTVSYTHLRAHETG